MSDIVNAHPHSRALPADAPGFAIVTGLCYRQ